MALAKRRHQWLARGRGHDRAPAGAQGCVEDLPTLAYRQRCCRPFRRSPGRRRRNRGPGRRERVGQVDAWPNCAWLAGGGQRAVRASMQPIFQDAAAALNPRRSARGHLLQALAARGSATEAEAIALLESVGLRPGHDYLNRLPHELSGGQRQRLTIARALAPQPRLIVADEHLSGADVSIRGQILNLLLDIKQQRAIAYLLITHDISVARAFADRVAVMMMGEIVETGPAERVLRQPQHDYTRRLLRAVPAPPARRSGP